MILDGLCNILIDDVDVGITMADTTISINTSNETLKFLTEYSKKEYDEIITKENINISFSLPFTEENKNRFSNNAIYNVNLKIITIENNYTIEVPNAKLKIKYNLNFTKNRTSYINVSATSLDIKDGLIITM
jgi:hypothetical protein